MGENDFHYEGRDSPPLAGGNGGRRAAHAPLTTSRLQQRTPREGLARTRANAVPATARKRGIRD